MKPGTRITEKNLPRRNGRPQLWYSWNEFRPWMRIRIIYPTGRVEWDSINLGIDHVDLTRGCTSRRSQIEAQKACFEYSKYQREETYWGGYL